MIVSRWRAFIICVAFSLAACANARETDRIALVIGNANYHDSRLNLGSVPVKDARDMRKTLLEDLNFSVGEPKIDLTRQQMHEAIDDFFKRSGKSKVGVLYYSGHGMQQENGETYLIPVDATLSSDNELKKKELISLRTIVVQLEAEPVEMGSGPGEYIVILDACRDNGTGKIGLTDPYKPRRTLIAYAAQSGGAASNKPSKSRNSVYTSALLEEIVKVGQKAQTVFDNVADKVAFETDNRQQPYHSESGPTNFEFVPFKAPGTTTPPS